MQPTRTDSLLATRGTYRCIRPTPTFSFGNGKQQGYLDGDPRRTIQRRRIAEVAVWGVRNRRYHH